MPESFAGKAANMSLAPDTTPSSIEVDAASGILPRFNNQIGALRIAIGSLLSNKQILAASAATIFGLLGLRELDRRNHAERSPAPGDIDNLKKTMSAKLCSSLPGRGKVISVDLQGDKVQYIVLRRDGQGEKAEANIVMTNGTVATVSSKSRWDALQLVFVPGPAHPHYKSFEASMELAQTKIARRIPVLHSLGGGMVQQWPLPGSQAGRPDLSGTAAEGIAVEYRNIVMGIPYGKIRVDTSSKMLSVTNIEWSGDDVIVQGFDGHKIMIPVGRATSEVAIFLNPQEVEKQ